MTTATRLWETEHPYYCHEANYFAAKDRGGPFEYGSWAEFAEGFGEADLDMNLVFRWDWRHAGTEWHDEPHDVLQIFILHQRKGRYACHRVAVEAADEPAARAWLQARWEHLQRLWTPFAAPPAEEETR